MLNWEIRSVMYHFRLDGRWTVLGNLDLHSNVRKRCFPSIDTIVQETGWASKAVVAAIRWLRECDALILVPFDKRIGLEIELPMRQHVYQLTGRIMLDGKSYTYLYLDPKTLDEIDAFVENLDDESEVVASKTVAGKTLPSTGKGSTSSKIVQPKVNKNSFARKKASETEEPTTGTVELLVPDGLNKDKQRASQFDCTFCGEKDTIGILNETTPCCGARIIWHNNAILAKIISKRTAEAKAADRSNITYHPAAQLVLNTAKVRNSSGTKIEFKPGEAERIIAFVESHDLAALKRVIEHVESTDPTIEARGFIAYLLKALPYSGKQWREKPYESMPQIIDGDLYA